MQLHSGWPRNECINRLEFSIPRLYTLSLVINEHMTRVFNKPYSDSGSGSLVVVAPTISIVSSSG